MDEINSRRWGGTSSPCFFSFDLFVFFPIAIALNLYLALYLFYSHFLHPDPCHEIVYFCLTVSTKFENNMTWRLLTLMFPTVSQANSWQYLPPRYLWERDSLAKSCLFSSVLFSYFSKGCNRHFLVPLNRLTTGRAPISSRSELQLAWKLCPSLTSSWTSTLISTWTTSNGRQTPIWAQPATGNHWRPSVVYY